MKQQIRQQILLKIRQKFHGIYSRLPQQKVHQLVCLTYIHIVSFNSTTLVMTIKILYVEVFVILDQLNSTLLKKLVCLIGFSSLTLTALNYMCNKTCNSSSTTYDLATHDCVHKVIQLWYYLVLNLFVFSPVTQVPQQTI